MTNCWMSTMKTAFLTFAGATCMLSSNLVLGRPRDGLRGVTNKSDDDKKNGKGSMKQKFTDPMWNKLKINSTSPPSSNSEPSNIFAHRNRVPGSSLNADDNNVYYVQSVTRPPATDVGVQSMLDVLVGEGYNVFVDLLKATGLSVPLDTVGSTFTLFAPTDEAFHIIPAEIYECLSANPDILMSLLLYHIVHGDKSTAVLADYEEIPSTQSSVIRIQDIDSTIILNGAARIVQPDLIASTGRIHGINDVLVYDSFACPAAVIDNPAAETSSITSVETKSPSQSPTRYSTLSPTEPPSVSPTKMPSLPPTTIVETTPSENAYELLKSLNLNMMARLVDLTGLTAGLSDEANDLTIFAPTNDAWDDVPANIAACLINNTDVLSDLILYHIIPGSFSEADLLQTELVSSVQGNPVAISRANDTSITNINGGSAIVSSNIPASNGIVHTISNVLVYPGFSCPRRVSESVIDTLQASGFTIFPQLLTAVGLDTVVLNENSQFTLLVPTNAALNSLPVELSECLITNPDVLNEMLLYHIIEGGYTAGELLEVTPITTRQGSQLSMSYDGASEIYTINGGINISRVDVQTTNGYIQGIDSVLFPDGFTCPQQSTDELDDVATTLRNNGLTSFADLLSFVGLDTALGNVENELTIFAPSNEALALLSEETASCILNDSDLLAQLLLYHMLTSTTSGPSFTAADGILYTIQGSELTYTLDDNDQVTLNGVASLTDRAIRFDNGVIQVVDAVLMYDGFSCP